MVTFKNIHEGEHYVLITLISYNTKSTVEFELRLKTTRQVPVTRAYELTGVDAGLCVLFVESCR